MTPDSFSDGGQFIHLDHARKHVEDMIVAGAEIIDIGAESTRPGAASIPPHEQINRLTPILADCTQRYDVAISIDTTSAEVAKFALSQGATIINDISGLRNDPKLAAIVAKKNATIVINHSRGTPETMQVNPKYTNVIDEVKRELNEGITQAKAAGITQIIIDPGIGFGKNLENNLTILAQLNQFKTMGYPLMIGTSRKSFIQKITNESDTTRLSGTIASNLWALSNGVKVFRVHDVAEVSKAIKVWTTIQTFAEQPL